MNADQRSPAQISRMIAEGVAAEVIRTVRCDGHGEVPVVAIVAAEPDGVEYSISGCCEALRKKARAAVDGLLGAQQPDEGAAQHGGSDEYSMA